MIPHRTVHAPTRSKRFSSEPSLLGWLNRVDKVSQEISGSQTKQWNSDHRMWERTAGTEGREVRWWVQNTASSSVAYRCKPLPDENSQRVPNIKTWHTSDIKHLSFWYFHYILYIYAGLLYWNISTSKRFPIYTNDTFFEMVVLATLILLLHTLDNINLFRCFMCRLHFPKKIHIKRDFSKANMDSLSIILNYHTTFK